MPPYAEFLIDFAARHAGHVHRNDPANDRAAVIVETRADFFLPMVIRNVMFFLGPGWNLHVVTSRPNVGYLAGTLPGWRVGIRPLPLDRYHLPVRYYNQLLLEPGFWHAFAESRLLIFQTDSLLCRPGVDDYDEWDLVGAPCGDVGPEYTANGGLSLRDRQLMIDCLDTATPGGDEPEDVFFTRIARKLGARIPDLTTAARFSCEVLFAGPPVGVHGTDKYWHDLDVARTITASIRY